MKKIFITISLLLPLALSTAPVFAATSYTRSPSDNPVITGDIDFSFSYSDWFYDVVSKSSGNTRTWYYWQLQITDGTHYFATDPILCNSQTSANPNYINANCDSGAPTSVDQTFNLPEGNYSYQFCVSRTNSLDGNGFFIGPYSPPYDPNGTANSLCGNAADYGDPAAHESFTVDPVPPPPTPPTPALAQSINPGDLSVPTSTTHYLLASVGNVVDNPGMLALIVVCAAIPLVFWFANEAISLPPKDKKKK